MNKTLKFLPLTGPYCYSCDDFTVDADDQPGVCDFCGNHRDTVDYPQEG